MDPSVLETRLGYRFEDASLLAQALTHRSFGQPNNERLEFLGDSLLNCVIAALLFKRFPKLAEGDLSRLRSNLVKQQSLFEVARAIELSAHLRLGDGERKSGGHRRPSILADSLEAILGAIFLDGGFEAVSAVIGDLYGPIIVAVDPKTLGKDAKTLLQEEMQGRRLPLPVYTVVATHGAAHSQEFEVECSIPKLGIQVLGSGASRRAAEQEAAKLALESARIRSGGRGGRRRPATAESATRQLEPARVSREAPGTSARAAAGTPSPSGAGGRT
ncbi:MAG: ribonuclease III [Burkholderiaceae bacterium]|nr:ribonuclease III [Burkholderiaceae bacterium]